MSGWRGREWLWKDGHRHAEGPDDAWLWGSPERHPVGAFWWRYIGEPNWRPVPGRDGMYFITPAETLS